MFKVFCLKCSCTRFSAWWHAQQDCFFLLSIGRRRVVKPVRDLTLIIRECFVLHCACLCLEQLTYQLIKTRDAVVRRQLLRQRCEACGLFTFLCSHWLVFAVCLNLAAVWIVLRVPCFCVYKYGSNEYSFYLFLSLFSTWTFPHLSLCIEQKYRMRRNRIK
jgi:hypothetical protein